MMFIYINILFMEYICKICVKKYASYNSLWYHNKTKHSIGSVKVDVKDVKVSVKDVKVENNVKVQKIKDCKYKCDNCNKYFSCRQSKYEHKKNICNNIKENKDIEEIMKLKLEIDILKLKLELNKTKPTNFKSLNKMLKDKNYNSNNIINSNNTVNNTINLIGFGKEKILESLSLNDKKMILSSKYHCIEKLIEISNCGNHNQFIQNLLEKNEIFSNKVYLRLN